MATKPRSTHEFRFYGGRLAAIPALAPREPGYVTDVPRLYVGNSTFGNTLLAVLHKIDGTAAPTINDDANAGYSAGSTWTDTTNDKSYTCVDSTGGAAIWSETTAAGVSDGDKGDITVSVGGTVWTIDKPATADYVYSSGGWVQLGSDEFVVGVAASAPLPKTPTQVRTILGLATTDSPMFMAIELGHATDTTLARVSAGVVSIEGVNILTTATGQPLDGTLTALAAYNTNGVICQTAADTFAGRTLTAPAAGITISNPAGIAGNPTFALANDLSALEGLGSTGIAVRTGADAWSQRSIAVGGFLTVANADGSGGNPQVTGAVNAQVADDIALDDDLLFWDTSGSEHNKVTTERLLGFNALIPGGRLSVATGSSVPGNTTSTTIYYAIHDHNRIRLYDGTRWKLYTFTERSLALTMTDAKNYDVFIYDNAGTITLELSAAWTNDTTRADALTTQDGVYVKSGAATRLWLGTIRASAANTVSDSVTKRFIWNAYNRLSANFYVFEATDSWTYSTAAWRQANAATGNKFECVNGLASASMIDMRVSSLITGSAAGLVGTVGVGEDATNALATEAQSGSAPTVPGGATIQGGIRKSPALGYHYYAWLEFGDASGTVTWYGDAGVATRYRSGLIGHWEC